MVNQAYVFIAFIFNGFLIGIFFDIFRILRRSFKTPDLITYIEDFVFWIITGASILYTIFKFNNGIIRGYIFLGIGLGILTYILIFSKIFIKVNIYIINFMKKFFNIIIIIPLIFIFKILRKVILRPISFIFINIRGNMSKLKDKTLKMIVNNKKLPNKKDFI